MGDVQGLLVDVSGDLFAVDPRLAIIEETIWLVIVSRIIAPLIAMDLLVIDARLVSIASELLSIANRLL